MSVTVATVYSEAFPLDVDEAAPRSCQLVVIEGPDMGRAVTLGDGEVIVGTGEACDLVLRDERISRRHLAAQMLDGGQVEVRDLDSRNGTLYQGSIVGLASVPIGATLKLGRTFLRIQPGPRHLDIAPSQSRRLGAMVAESLAMRELFAVLELAAPTDVTILIEGETGTGKELCARAIHERSARGDGPFVVVDCGALPEGVLDSELFGHVEGAFTGASRTREGAFARASGGTLFLDELDSISLDAQARLLRALESGQIRPVGADHEVDVDVRVIAAAGVGLEQLVAEGEFRPDLFYRLAVVCVRIPPLRDRREDIPLIVEELMRRRGLAPEPVRPCANLHRLMAHDWPGNVRELRNVIERAIALTPGEVTFEALRVDPGLTTPAAAPMSVRTDLPYSEAKKLLLANFERRYLQDLITRCEGNISYAARVAKLDRKHLRDLLRRNDLI